MAAVTVHAPRRLAMTQEEDLHRSRLCDTPGSLRSPPPWRLPNPIVWGYLDIRGGWLALLLQMVPLPRAGGSRLHALGIPGPYPNGGGHEVAGEGRVRS